MTDTARLNQTTDSVLCYGVDLNEGEMYIYLITNQSQWIMYTKWIMVSA